MHWWLAVLVGCTWADLRPRVVRVDPDELTEARARGRALLDEAAAAHGLEAWREYETMTVDATDTWEVSGSWWPGDVQRFVADRELGTFDSRVRLVGGEADGEVWGIQAWRPYRDGAFLEQDTAIAFYLPTLQYFDELPFRLITAEHAVAAGTSDSGHQRVFATWGELGAHGEADHYVVYLDPDTGRIERVAYTIREAHEFAPWVLRGLMKPLAVGTIHFRDLREVDGVWVPHTQIVTLGDGEKPGDPADRVFHRIDVHSVAFDAVEPEVLRVDPSLPRGADSKP